MQHVVYGAGSDHQSRIDGAANDPSQRIPCSLVEPVQEVIEPVLYHVCRRAVVEPVTQNTADSKTDSWLKNIAAGPIQRTMGRTRV